MSSVRKETQPWERRESIVRHRSLNLQRNMKVKQRDLKGHSWVGKINLKRKRLNPYLLIRVVLEIKRKSWLLVRGVLISGSVNI